MGKKANYQNFIYFVPNYFLKYITVKKYREIPRTTDVLREIPHTFSFSHEITLFFSFLPLFTAIYRAFLARLCGMLAHVQ